MSPKCIKNKTSTFHLFSPLIISLFLSLFLCVPDGVPLILPVLASVLPYQGVFQALKVNQRNR